MQNLNVNQITEIFAFVSNLLKLFAMATKEEFLFGIGWYKKANELSKEWAKLYNIPVWKVSGIISAYSINNGWLQNVRWAELFIQSKFGKAESKGLGIQKEYAQKIWDCKNYDQAKKVFLDENKRTYKLYCFFVNIYKFDKVQEAEVYLTSKIVGFLPIVTMDRHAISGCLNDPTETPKSSQTKGRNYLKYALAYAIAAKTVGLTPQQFQAVVWLVVRRLKEVSKHHG